MADTIYHTTRQTGIATDAWANDSPPKRTAMLQAFLVVLSPDEGYADRKAGIANSKADGERGGQ